jgi:hypothetical protein
MMSVGFDSDQIILKKLRERLRRRSDEGLIKFGKDVRRLAENPFQRQLEAATAEEAEKRSGRFEQIKHRCIRNQFAIRCHGISVVFEPAQLLMLIQRPALPSNGGVSVYLVRTVFHGRSSRTP